MKSITDSKIIEACGLVGAVYGLESLPVRWLKTLRECSVLRKFCENAANT